MPTDFHYVPLTPEPLSGPEFIDQTERAINELGANIDDAQNVANQAITTANNAVTTANDALLEAQNAGADADAAQSTANTALSTANTALADAATAISTANNAFDTAAIADSNAGDALDTANTALATAETASSVAATAGQNAEQSLMTASAALDYAERAIGIFAVTAEAVDANEEYDGAEKLYLTNGSADTPNANLPSDLSAPIYFEVFITDDGASVTQTAWDTTAQKVFTRCGSVNDSDPDNPVVTWTPWNSVAVPETVKNVTVEANPSGQPAGTYLVITFDTETGDETVYINLSQVIGAYTAGNGAIDVSADNQISLKLDTTGDNPLTVTENGLAINAAVGVPSGFIGMWSGGTEQIPAGWLLCDGENGTPDLRDRFIVGAGTTYAVGDTGGAASVTPAGSISNTTAGGTVANTTITTATMPNHYHTISGGNNNYFAARGYGGGGNYGMTNINEPNITNSTYVGINWSGGGDGAHNHGFTGTSHGHTFTGAALENRPPYYALAYIMKV
jgi:hypothetical protein